MEDREQKANSVVERYLSIAKKNQRLPTYADLLTAKITRNQVRDLFGNLTGLHEVVEKEHPVSLAEGVAHESVIFSKKKMAELSSSLKKFKRFVVTTAVSGKSVFPEFLSSIRSYCDKNEAKLIILPCADVASTSTVVKKWSFDPLLKDDLFIQKETRLNSNFFLSNIKISAKQINPTTGLSRVGQRNGSYVFASPKQQLDFVATSGLKKSGVMALMTPGAITRADYSNERYMSDRTSYIAETDHVFGAVVVEIVDNKEFHFRQIQANANGEFMDLGKRHFPDGSVREEECDLVMGDYHAMEIDPTVKKATKEICEVANVRNVVVHDFFDGKSINHHDSNRPLKKVMSIREGTASLENEIEVCAREIDWLHEIVKGNVVHVRGNHDDRLENWLLEAEYSKDPLNHYFALDLVKTLLDGGDPLSVSIASRVRNKKRIVWLQRDDEFKIAGIEVGQHGDMGSNGTRGSLRSMENAYGNCVIGHTHSGAILRGVFRVGTSTPLRVGYNKGPSSWTNTHCLVSKKGDRQLINIFDGRWRLK